PVKETRPPGRLTSPAARSPRSRAGPSTAMSPPASVRTRSARSILVSSEGRSAGPVKRNPPAPAARASRARATTASPPWLHGSVTTPVIVSRPGLAGPDASTRGGNRWPRDRVQRLGQGDRVLHGELGPRADGVVGGMRRVAEQHGPAGGPALAAHRAEPGPPGPVADQGVSLQLPGERLLQVAQGGEVGGV